MANKNDSNKLLAGLLVVVIVVAVAGLALNLALVKSLQTPLGGSPITGFVTEIGNTSFTQAGAAGLNLPDSDISFGSGFYNTTCGAEGQDHSELNSFAPGSDPRPVPGCWINTSGYPLDPDTHILENNGSTALQINATSNKDADDFMCNIGGSCSDTLANVSIRSDQGEASSCSGPTGAFVFFTNSSLNLSREVCSSLQFQDTSDTINVTYRLTVPNDIPSGSKSMLVTYEAVAT